ncbi:MAG: D-tyrosyl-tRNA(Tyr) deacylase [Thermogutta sp.]|uniref:D-aminoacyl-tRNA deacylase n=1 Tax=Thermogutta sp. TaxID=1962930 RepID=UPI0019933642|nr:D-aminoacyl-tRNA deacylase [Thermogutta sp.]MBC7352277.1 D-tyrosyl-tRNA(Tyr) deacylase [Thermogutta sp.]
MRACIQRVQWARVKVNAEVVGEIKKGVLVLLGVAVGDTEKETKLIADKVAQLRIFEDEQGKMNLSLAEVGGAVLVVSQFTLLADCRKGRRPSFTKAAAPQDAEKLVDQFVQILRGYGLPVATGRFREHMEVELLNDGPVTILLDSDELSRPRRGRPGVVE